MNTGQKNNMDNLFDDEAENEPICIFNNLVIKDISSYSRHVNYASDEFTFILTENGLYCFGYNFYGQLGIHPVDDNYVIMQIIGLTKLEIPKEFKKTNKNIKTVINNKMINVKQLCINDTHEFIIDENNNVYCRGNNDSGQLGTGDNENRDSYEKINALENVKEIECGQSSSLFLTESKELYAIGENVNNQLGSDYVNNNTFTHIMSNVNHVKTKENLTIVEVNNKLLVAGKGSDFTER